MCDIYNSMNKNILHLLIGLKKILLGFIIWILGYLIYTVSFPILIDNRILSLIVLIGWIVIAFRIPDKKSNKFVLRLIVAEVIIFSLLIVRRAFF